jgi:hypothetical protein
VPVRGEAAQLSDRPAATPPMPAQAGTRARQGAVAFARRGGPVAGRTAVVQPGHASATLGNGTYRLVGGDIEFELPVVADGDDLGRVTLHVAPNQLVYLRLRDLVALVGDRFAPEQLARLSTAPDIDTLISLEKLRDAGIDLRYDAARDRLSLSAEPG